MDQPLANIHPEARIGKNVTIEPFVTIEKDVEIGEGTWIGPNAVIMNGARIGKNCSIFPGAVISSIPQDLKFKGEVTTAEIGDNTSVREYVTVNRGTAAKGKTVVGANCLLQSCSHVAHDCIVKDNCILGSYAALAGEVEVDDFAIVSPYSAVHQFVRIGTHAFIQATSKVGKDVPPFILAGREPLAYCGVNSVGLRRRGFSNDEIFQMQEIYRFVFQKGLNTSNALKQISENIEKSKQLDVIVSFIENSPRGIIKGLLDVKEAK
ncbi:MAG: acyl-ACP--UDP-N-acetylglucosamine O-acyltransferase [Bacteroidales bacterium]|nr:acyl-ACP--UDP-N-acetylglucosamine O-acyltransferase [Bacteroidales bacterium]